jgi:hypothetical protein
VHIYNHLRPSRLMNNPIEQIHKAPPTADGTACVSA